MSRPLGTLPIMLLLQAALLHSCILRAGPQAHEKLLPHPPSVTSTQTTSEIVKVKLDDHEVLIGKLDLPGLREPVREIVVYVHGTGPGTYLDRRKIGEAEFNYFDLFSHEFNTRGVGFFSYNKRGVTVGDQPPTFEKIDRQKFLKVVPSIEARDLGSVVRFLRGQKRLAKAKIVLLGWSEGTILAAMAAEDPKNRIDGIFLAGYCNENMFDIIRWQFSGESSMVNIAKYFDANADNRLSKEEYNSEALAAANVRANALRGAQFEQLDVNKDGWITAEDFKLLMVSKYGGVLEAVRTSDDAWIWDNYFHVSTAWLRQHFALEANKSRLLRLNIPISIFHGKDDANCPVEGVLDIQRRFKTLSKDNLRCQIFEGHNHDLNYLDFITKKEISLGIKAMIEAIAGFGK